MNSKSKNSVAKNEHKDKPKQVAVAAAVAEVSVCEDECAWLDEGHEWIGLKVIRQFGTKQFRGCVTKWVPANEDDGDEALWHVVHTDGDEEDLNVDEMTESLELARVEQAELEEAELTSLSKLTERQQIQLLLSM